MLGVIWDDIAAVMHPLGGQAQLAGCCKLALQLRASSLAGTGCAVHHEPLPWLQRDVVGLCLAHSLHPTHLLITEEDEIFTPLLQPR